MRQARWSVKKTDGSLAEKLAGELKISPFLAGLLANRGMDSSEAARSFLSPDLESLGDPFEMADMRPAVDRLAKALQDKEKIFVHGDYDADGITATAFCHRFLADLGGEVGSFLPGRVEDGYGLQRKGVDRALEAGAGLLLTVDCGVTALEEIAYARAKGLSVIITDHHLPGADLPEAEAVLDPNRPDCAYPFKALAGVGVVFQLARALAAQLGKGQPENYLDLVALGSVADVVPLLDENRAMVKHGLDLISRGSNPGLARLKRVAGINESVVNSGHLAFGLGPRLNAAGRIGNAHDALELLLEDDGERCGELARKLNDINRQRQQMERQAVEQAMERVAGDPLKRERAVLVLSDPDWHPGIVGLVASRLAQKYNRPAMVIREDGLTGRGSARSVDGVDIHGLLGECAELLVTYGGHKAAAGLEIELARIPEFEEKISRLAEARAPGEAAGPLLQAEARLELDQLDSQLVTEIGNLEPFGAKNPRPLFLLEGLKVAAGQARIVGRDHLRLELSGARRKLKAIGFGLGERLEKIGQGPLHLLGWPEHNEWQGRREVQFLIKDLKTGPLDLVGD
jgi:single-stranded-DNA-specific exonuclease